MYTCTEEKEVLKGDIVARAYAPERVAGDRSEFDPRQIQHWISCRIQGSGQIQHNTAQNYKLVHIT